MGRIEPQATLTVFSYAASLAAGASTSGSVGCQGFATMVGAVFVSDSTLATCGIKVSQSLDAGSSWDIVSASNAVANNSSTACTTSILGNAIRVEIQNGATAASRIRALFYLKPL